MPRVQAWEQLCNPEYSGRLGAVGMYDLLIRAGYDHDAAQEAANKRGWDRLAAGQEM